MTGPPAGPAAPAEPTGQVPAGPPAAGPTSTGQPGTEWNHPSVPSPRNSGRPQHPANDQHTAAERRVAGTTRSTIVTSVPPQGAWEFEEARTPGPAPSESSGPDPDADPDTARPPLPKRRKQEHLAWQLRTDGPPSPPSQDESTAGHDPGLMAAFQRGVTQADDEESTAPPYTAGERAAPAVETEQRKDPR